jgi:hypothetical protein
MSTRSNATSIRRARPRPGATRRRGAYFVVCLSNDGYQASLEPRKFYLALPDRAAAAHGQLRVVDESGEDYLFPAERFEAVEVSPALRKRLLAAV